MTHVLLAYDAQRFIVPVNSLILSAAANGVYSARIFGDNGEGGPKSRKLDAPPRLVTMAEGLAELAALAKPN